MLLLRLSDLLEVCDLLGVEAESGKVGFGKLGEALAVKGFFQVF